MSGRLRKASLRRYTAVAGIALRQELSERGALLGRVLFYGVTLLIFSRLWAVVLADAPALERAGLAGSGLGRGELLWYLAVTEWVVLSVPAAHLTIERDIRSGDIAYRLARPISYLGFQCWSSLGALAPRLAVLAAAGVVLARAAAGAFPADPRSLPLCLPLGVAAAVVLSLCNVLVGLTAFWLQDCSPVYWIWQKLAFLFGGLMLPLEVYPVWLREIAACTPFAALLHGPGRMAFGADLELAAWAGFFIVFWGGVACATLAAAFQSGLRVLDVNGG